MPKVSIGLPVYNGEEFIREAIDSLVAQTFTDFELIVSDNASVDGTEAICQEYVRSDSRIVYHRQGENLGATANFEFVLDRAAGEFFMWAAADDEWLPTFISDCLVALENDSNCGFAMTKYTVVSRFSSVFSRRFIPELRCVAEADRGQRVLEYSGMPFSTHKDNLVYALWRREAIIATLLELRLSPVGKVLIGASMNEYALSKHRGAYVDQTLFRKKYRYLPPGHFLGTLVNSVLTRVRRLVGSGRESISSYGEAEHLSDLREVLSLGGFQEDYIVRVLEVNRAHMGSE